MSSAHLPSQVPKFDEFERGLRKGQELAYRDVLREFRLHANQPGAFDRVYAYVQELAE